MRNSVTRSIFQAMLLSVITMAVTSSRGGTSDPNRPDPATAAQKRKKRRLADIIKEYQEVIEESENPDLRILVEDFRAAIDFVEATAADQHRLPDDIHTQTADLLGTNYRTRPGDDGRTIPRNKTVGTSVDEETYVVFNTIVNEFSANKKPGIVVGQMIEKFILTARPQVRLLYEGTHPGMHDVRCQTDQKYGSIFSWEPRYVLPDSSE